MRISPTDGPPTDLPPTLVLHGEVDAVVPFADVQRLAAASATCELVGYPGAGHGFLNYRFGDLEPGGAFADTLRRMDAVLTRLAFISSAA